MKNRRSSFKLVRVLVIAMLVGLLFNTGAVHAQTMAPGTVVAWGNNGSGQSTVPAGLGDVTAVAAGWLHSLALKADGTVAGWGSNIEGQISVPASLSGVTAIAAGGNHSLALEADGTVVAWGSNGAGESSVPAGLSGITAIAAGQFHSLALKADGTVVAWGNNGSGQSSVPEGLSGVTAIAAGYAHSLALKGDGTVVAWGLNGNGQSSVPDGLSGVAAIAAGGFHNLALKADGTVVAWGWNEFGQSSVPDGLSNVTAIATGHARSLALKGDGTVVGWGYNGDGQRSVPAGLSGVIAIADGGHHSLALVQQDSNTAPTANPGGPYLGAVNTAILFDGSGSSDPDSDLLTYAWDFGDGGTGTGVTPTHSYTAAGVYNACLTVNDGSLDSTPACTMAVVYDPSAGFVTGGGWIDSPAGAYKADASLAGKATFGFISKYQKGASVPSGTTAFEFDLAGLEFSSTSYDWLVVNQAGTNAQFKGSGLINGAADPNGNAYRFMLWAGDGSPDTFRIRIWWEDAAGEHDVYDNGTAQAIGAGNIVVHTGK